jgi:hypothetical protein
MTNDQLQEKILKNSYSVQRIEYGILGGSFEMRRKFKGGTPFLTHYLPTTGSTGAIDFYFPTRHLPADEIFKQFESL